MNRIAHCFRRIEVCLPVLLLACGSGDTTAPPPAPTPAVVSITPPEATLAALGQTVQLTATVHDQNGAPMTGVALNWASSDGGVATVNAFGLVTAIRNGGSIITAAVQGGGPSATATVTVMQQVSEVRLSPTSETLRSLGDTLRLSAETLDASSSPVAGAPLTWSSSDESVVTVDATGLVTAVGNGSTRVAAASGATTAAADLSVEQQPVTVRLSPEADTLRPAGDTLRIFASARDANDHAVEGAQFIWSSSDESVASVDAAGLVTTNESGTVEIMAEVAGTRLVGLAVLHVLLSSRDILVAFYNATGGPHWKNSDNWLTDAPLDTWYGVTTDSAGSELVVALELRRNGLKGTIPRELGSLTSLTTLHLLVNALSGSIPPELGNLPNLQSLLLDGNALTGPIPPELGTLPGLSTLGLSVNRLSGPIPPELGNFVKLRRLNLEQNALSGPIPPELGNLVNLTVLDLANNRITGWIPPELGNLKRLWLLDLSYANLTGPIPPELTKLTDLVWLYLTDNDLTGPIPQAFVDIPLREFHWIGTMLCAPANDVFQAWLRTIESHIGGPTCSP